MSSEDCRAISTLLVKLGLAITDSEYVCVNSIFCKYASISLKGKVFYSSVKKLKPVVAMAKWEEVLYGVPPSAPQSGILGTNNIRPVDIKYYANIYYTVESVPKQIILAFVSWFFPHPQRFSLGKPAELWSNSMFESYGTCSFLPIRNIICRCAHGVKLYNDEHVLVVVPLVE